jgi:excisionase family DNA binding protein
VTAKKLKHTAAKKSLSSSLGAKKSIGPSVVKKVASDSVHVHKHTGTVLKARRVAGALKFTVDLDVDPLLAIMRRHVHVSPNAARQIQDDLLELFSTDAPAQNAAAPQADEDVVLTSQEAADLVGVSRPYMVARIDAGDVALHQQVGNQRRVLRSAVLAWQRKEQTRRRKALVQLGAELDDEIFQD